MFTSIRLRNFKSYRDSGTVRLAPLTIIVGRNNAGKSALFQPLLALRQTLKDPSWGARLVTSGQFVDLGGFSDIVHAGEGREVADVRFDIGREGVEAVPFLIDGRDISDESNVLSLTFGFDLSKNRTKVKELVFSNDKGPLATFSESGTWSAKSVTQIQKKNIKIAFRNFLVTAGVQSSKSKPGTIPAKRVVSLMPKAFQIEMQSNSWMTTLHNVSHVTPLRMRVPWYSGTTRRGQSDYGISGSELIRILCGDSEVADLKTKKSLVERVNHWVSDSIGVLKNVRVESIDQSGLVGALLADDPDGAKGLNVAGMGEGISQLLPIIATLESGRKDGTIVIEQPEIHLHPKAQADIGDLFVKVASGGKRQIIVETHSEHLLLRIRRHVAEGAIDASRVAVLFVEKKGGQSCVRELAMDDRGQFDDWPEGFFDEGYQEAMALAMASSKKSK